MTVTLSYERFRKMSRSLMAAIGDSALREFSVLVAIYKTAGVFQKSRPLSVALAYISTKYEERKLRTTRLPLRKILNA